MTPAKTLTTGLLIAGIAVGTYAALGKQSPAATGSSAEDAPRAELPPGHPAPGETQDDLPKISGKVVELIQVPSYTYLRLDRGEHEELWVAVPKSDVPKGKVVRLAHAERMENFSSKQLDRTFPVIYFGTLETGVPESAADNPHAAAPGKRSGRAEAADMVKIHASQRAEGENGHTVAGIFAETTGLAGQSVRVRGTVVQVTMNVMGTNFVHIRDGSGDPKEGTHDLVLKVDQDPPNVGQQALFEGVLEREVDLGAGYTYAALVSSARVLDDDSTSQE